MKVSRFIFNMFGINTYLLWDPVSNQALIVDPGMIDTPEQQTLDRFIAKRDLIVTHLVNTHMHLDHIFGNQYVTNRYGVKVEAHPDDEFLGLTLTEQSKRFHIPVETVDHGADVHLKDGDIIRLGLEEIHIIAVPGHSPGSIALYAPDAGFVITGDALFRGDIGRTDLPGGNHTQLVNSIRTRLLTLPPDTLVLPGHGDISTIGQEATSNPYVN